jgi:photosystem II stability/assembly factor-like uncharacterized protein
VDARPAVALLVSGKLAWARGVGALARWKRSFASGSIVERIGYAALSVITVAAAVVATSPRPGATGPTRVDNHGSPASSPPALDDPGSAAPPPSSSRAHPLLAAAANDGSAATRDPAANSEESADEAPSLPVSRLPLDWGEDPEAGYIGQFASARNDPATVFAAGSAKGECDLPTCPALYRSSDGGRTWARLAALGYLGGDVLLPPNFPADPRIFVAAATALQVSHDGGASFEVLAPVRGPAAISPAFANSDPRILSSMSPGWEYRDDRGTATPLTWGDQLSTLRTFTFAPAYPADDRIFVGGTMATLASKTQSTVRVCRGSACGPHVALVGSSATPDVVLADDGLAIAWRTTKLYRSRDGGLSFEELRAPAEGSVSSVLFGGDSLFVTMAGVGAGGTSKGGIFVSHDAGTSWTRLGDGTAVGRSVMALAWLGGGRLLAAPSTSDGGGVACSTDGGQTWAPRCAA